MQLSTQKSQKAYTLTWIHLVLEGEWCKDIALKQHESPCAALQIECLQVMSA